MAERGPRIFVLAGTNGAGKSSIGGVMIRSRGARFFNPDEAAARIRAVNPSLPAAAANAAAWNEGRRLLERAIAERREFAFETTLGGKTMVGLLEQAATNGFRVIVWFAGLASPELHIARVRARVKKGGHDIPEADIRRRYDDARRNLIRLLPKLAELRVYDNSADGDPATGKLPPPLLVLRWKDGAIQGPQNLSATPQWAKPIVAAALKLVRRR